MPPDAAGLAFKTAEERLKLALYSAIAALCESDRSTLSTIIDFFDNYNDLLRFLFIFGGETIRVPTLNAVAATLPVASAALAHLRGESAPPLPPDVTKEQVDRCATVLRRVLERKDQSAVERQEILQKLGL